MDSKLPLTSPPPHFHHQVLRGSGLLAVAERDVETSRRLHVLHQDLHRVPLTKSGWLFQALTLQGVRGHEGRAAHLRVHRVQARSGAALEYTRQLLTRLDRCCAGTWTLVSRTRLL